MAVNIVVALLLNVTVAHAQDWRRFDVFAGAQVADFGTSIKLDATATIVGSTIDFERDLGFKETAGVAWVTGLWRISPRNQVQFFWSSVGRDALERRVQRDIRFGSSTFELNTEVDAFLDTSILGGSYRFAVIATPVVEVGPMVGLAAIKLSTGVSVSGSVSGEEDELSESAQREAKFTAAAILPGAFINLRAHPRLTIRASGGYISADFGDFNGQVVQAMAGADFMLTRWLGMGGNYSYQKLSVGLDKDTFDGDVRYSFGGPQVYTVFAF